MKYYIQDSIPLVEDYPEAGDRSYDQFGNYIEIDILENPIIIKESVLHVGNRIDDYIEDGSGYTSHTEQFLKGFWALSRKARFGNN